MECLTHVICILSLLYCQTSDFELILLNGYSLGLEMILAHRVRSLTDELITVNYNVIRVAAGEIACNNFYIKPSMCALPCELHMLYCNTVKPIYCKTQKMLSHTSANQGQSDKTSSVRLFLGTCGFLRLI